MKKLLIIAVFLVSNSVSVEGVAGSAEEMSASSVARGKALWNRDFVSVGAARSCSTCHMSNPRTQGKHVRTGKSIRPMAVSVTPDRLTDQRKVEKWFKRNCKWTIGRECTDQEKDDVLRYLNNI